MFNSNDLVSYKEAINTLVKKTLVLSLLQRRSNDSKKPIYS